MILYFINNCFPVSAGDESQILEIEDVVIHPKYDLSNAYQDIAVIKLKPNKGKLQISCHRNIYKLHLRIKLLVFLCCTVF